MTDKQIKKLRAFQHCFVSGGYMFCNFIIRGGKIIYSSKGMIKFPVGSKKKSSETKIEEKVDKIKQNGILQQINRPVS